MTPQGACLLRRVPSGGRRRSSRGPVRLGADCPWRDWPGAPAPIPWLPSSLGRCCPSTLARAFRVRAVRSRPPARPRESISRRAAPGSGCHAPGGPRRRRLRRDRRGAPRPSSGGTGECVGNCHQEELARVGGVGAVSAAEITQESLRRRSRVSFVWLPCRAVVPSVAIPAYASVFHFVPFEACEKEGEAKQESDEQEDGHAGHGDILGTGVFIRIDDRRGSDCRTPHHRAISRPAREPVLCTPPPAQSRAAPTASHLPGQRSVARASASQQCAMHPPSANSCPAREPVCSASHRASSPPCTCGRSARPDARIVDEVEAT